MDDDDDELNVGDGDEGAWGEGSDDEDLLSDPEEPDEGETSEGQ